MTTAVEVLAELHRHNVTVTVVGDDLRLRGRGLSPLIAQVKAVKRELLEYLRRHGAGAAPDDAEVAWRVTAMRRQIQPGAKAIPFLVARPDHPPRGRCCVSCGDPLPAQRPGHGAAAAPTRVGRCPACVAAVLEVLRGVDVGRDRSVH